MGEIYILDRIEDSVATLEKANGEVVNIPQEFLPENAVAGCVLVAAENGFYIDEQATCERRNRILKKRRSIFGKK